MSTMNTESPPSENIPPLHQEPATNGHSNTMESTPADSSAAMEDSDPMEQATAVEPMDITPKASIAPENNTNDSTTNPADEHNGARHSNGQDSVEQTQQATKVERGPLGLAQDEEDWVRDKMEYALHDFQVLALAIKRYRWQLSQVPKDISRLEELKEKYMQDPIEFLRLIRTKEFRYPEGQKTLPAPSIEWTKYQFPPANPIQPTKPTPITFLNSTPFAPVNTHSNIVSMSSSSRSRAGSPSSERMKIVKDTAKSLGIRAIHHHQPQYSQYQYDQGQSRMRTESHTGEDSQRVSFESGNQGYSRELSRPASQEAGSIRQDYGQSPNAGRSQDMEGITYTAHDGQKGVSQPRSTMASDSTTAQGGETLSIHSTPLVQQPQQSFQAPEIRSSEWPVAVPPYVPFESNGMGLGGHSNITYNHMSGSVDVQNGKGKSYAREGSGARDEPKPPLYNIPWSDEEQKLLEKLLDEYPDEPVAAQRFQKISLAMGTRTPKQVASRVQKYFIKLVKAGLEAPGRMNYSLEPAKPKTKDKSPKAKTKKRKDAPDAPKGRPGRPKKREDSAAAAPKKGKAKSLLGSGVGRISGAQYLHYSAAPTVYMSEEDDEESVQEMMALSNGNGTASAIGGVSTHVGFSCDSCGLDPILGTRFSCLDCEELGGTDLCNVCFNSGMYQNDHHFLSHRFQPIDAAESVPYGHDYHSHTHQRNMYASSTGATGMGEGEASGSRAYHSTHS